MMRHFTDCEYINILFTLLCMIKILSVHNNLIRSRNKNYKYLSLIFIHLLNLFLDGSKVLFIKINQTLGIHTKAFNFYESRNIYDEITQFTILTQLHSS